MKKIFVHITALDGCALHRLIIPYLEIKKQTNEFQIQLGYTKPVREMTFEEEAVEISQYDILVFHRLMKDGLLNRVLELNPNIKVIIDMDDDWRLNDTHPAAGIYRKEKTSEKILWHIKHSDYVTCTTEYLANKIRPFNNNIFIFNNALKAEGQFIPNPVKSDRIRLGLIGSSSHSKDYELLDGLVQQLPKEILDKVQFVLCGFDKGTYRVYKEDGTIDYMDMPYEKNVWHKFEVMLTDNYKTITKEHKDFLLEHKYKVDYSTDEAYHRVWAKDIDCYAEAYNQIDILLVPLLGNDFTACKSELKMIEASVMGKPVIASDVLPYTNCAINAIMKGGQINPNGNCILVNNQKGCRGFVKAIIRLVKDEDLRKMITDNIKKLALTDKYNLTEVTKKRIEFLKNIQ